MKHVSFNRPKFGHLTKMAVAASALMLQSSLAIAQEAQFAPLAEQFGPLNAQTGDRHTPQRVLPIPQTASEAAQALIAAPYSPYWNLAPTSDEEWIATVAASSEYGVQEATALREAHGITIEDATLGGVPVFILRPETVPEAHQNQVLINLHGGGYVFGPGRSGTSEATVMADIGGYEVIAVDYRMPPEAPFPAAVEDALAVYRDVLETHDPANVGIFGTSAGGGLTLSLVHKIKSEGLPVPGAIAPISPWSDLTETGDSYRTNEWIDNVLVSYDGYLGRAAALYADGHDLSDPLLSPINGDFDGFPPTTLTAGTRDLFLSNTARVHRGLRQEGIAAELHIFEGLSHAQHIFDWSMPETRELYREITAFFDVHLSD
ncbi:alpha/beta hydrolase fold domain-containing protein [Pseudosulfitobacter sp. SM2401]|uniref:alpha/beta hydrolase n=1 Tax=Pseudosulfitobacter sp. SM2401 TaxID=3350098 RepID=UPI0036F32E76